MAKRGPRPEPWLRKQTGTWYVTLNKKQVPLGKDETEAYEEFYRVMAARGEEPSISGKVTVRQLRELWLKGCGREKKSERTMGNYRLYSDSFVAMCGPMEARKLLPLHVDAWIESLEDAYEKKSGGAWASSTRTLAISIIKAMTSWGSKKGHLKEDPLEKVNAGTIDRREPITLEEAEGIMELVRPDIQDALRVLLTTGLRPGELCSMTAEKTDLKERKASVKGKSGVRTAYLAPAAIMVLRTLKDKHPAGHLLIDTKGKPMTVTAIETCVRRARRRLSEARFGKGKRMEFEHIKPHCFRGLFSTEALRAGAGVFQVSKLLGHKDPTILAKHYAWADDEMLLGAVDLATRRYDSSSGTPPDRQD